MSASPPEKAEVEQGDQTHEENSEQMDRGDTEGARDAAYSEFDVKEQDRWLPIANGMVGYSSVSLHCPIVLQAFEHIIVSSGAQMARWKHRAVGGYRRLLSECSCLLFIPAGPVELYTESSFVWLEKSRVSRFHCALFLVFVSISVAPSLPPAIQSRDMPRSSPPMPDSGSGSKSSSSESFGQSDANIRNFAPVARIMKSALPENAKIAKEAKECMQECVSEFISFITSEGT